MGRDTTVYIKKPNEIKIGLLGFSGAGKTTYQASLAYWLYTQTDEDLKGEPIGSGTREFLDTKVRELISGKFPEPTLGDVQLIYHMNFKNSEYLVNIIDYKGGDTPGFHSDTQEISPRLKDTADFFAQCNAYFIFIPVEDLLYTPEEVPIEKYAGIYDIIRYYQKIKEKPLKKLRNPMILVITKIDTVDISDKKLREKIENALERFIVRLDDKVKYYDKVMVSAIGGDFLDTAGRKRADAELKPTNITTPIKKIFETYEHRKTI